jgi:CHAD domain-containing protein
MPSRSYRLRREERASAGVRRIALGRIENALARLADAGNGDGDFATAIHDARKDVKKLRALLRLVRKELGEDLFKSENHRYRDAGRLLSGSRDAEVKLETLRALRSQYGEDLPGEASKRWEEELERERDRMVAAAGGVAAGGIEEAVRAIEEGRDRVLAWRLKTDSWKLLAPGLSETYRQGRRGMKRTLADPRAENVHEWRKRAKDLWYQLRIVREAWPEVLGATVDQAHQLTELLGRHHDLAVLAEDLASRRDLSRQEGFEATIRRRQEELLDGALRIGHRLYAEKPKAFSRRLKRYWSVWRQT